MRTVRSSDVRTDLRMENRREDSESDVDTDLRMEVKSN